MTRDEANQECARLYGALQAEWRKHRRRTARYDELWQEWQLAQDARTDAYRAHREAARQRRLDGRSLKA